MGNAQARRRIKASDFDYLAKNTNFLTLEVGGGLHCLFWDSALTTHVDDKNLLISNIAMFSSV